MIVLGFFGVVILLLERCFFLKINEVGVIVSCYDIVVVIMVVFVSYYGYYYKLKWLGIGVFILGIGCFLFVFFYILVGRYELGFSCINVCFFDFNVIDVVCKSFVWFYIFVFVIVEFFIGVGVIFVYILGLLYIDENVWYLIFGLFFGIMYVVVILGFVIGFLLGGEFFDIYVDI